MAHVKRKLTSEEILSIRQLMDSAPQGYKPSIRAIANRLGVNRPSVIKALGGWKGIQRNAPRPGSKNRVIDRNISSPIKIEEFEAGVPDKIYGK